MPAVCNIESTNWEKKTKDIQNLIKLAESKIHSGVTHAEALTTFVAAGIMDGNGEYTAPYQELLREAEQQEAYYFKEPMYNCTASTSNWISWML